MDPTIVPGSSAPTSSSTPSPKEQREGLAGLNRRMQELAHSKEILKSYLQAHPQGFPRKIPESIKLLIEKHFGELGSDVPLSQDIVHQALRDIHRQLHECHTIYPKTYHRSKPPHEPTLQPLPSPQYSSVQSPLEVPELLAKILSHLDPHDRAAVSLVDREWAATNSIAFKNREIESAASLISHIMNFLQSNYPGAYPPILDRLAALRDRTILYLQAVDKQQADAGHAEGSLMVAINQVFERLGDDIGFVLQGLDPKIRRSLSDAWGEREMPYAFGSDFLTRTDFHTHSSYPALPSQEEVEKAFTDAQTIPMTQELVRLMALGDVSQKWLLRGEFRKAFDGALLAYQTSPNEPFRGTPLRQVFEKIALFGGIERALAFLNEIKAELDPLDLNSIRNSILMNFRPTNDQELERAYSLAKELPQGDREIPMKRWVSLAMQRGDYVHAQKIATDEGSGVLLFFVEAIARKGHYNQAEAVIGSITTPDEQDAARAEVVIAMAQRGDYAKAIALIEDIPNPYAQDNALVGFVKAMAQRGDYARANAMIGTITNTIAQDKARVEVANTMRQRGGYTQAEAVIGSITTPDEQDAARADVVKAMAQRGDYSQAKNWIRSIARTYARNQACINFAIAMAQRGDYPQVEDLIESMTDRDARHQARTEFVKAMTQRGDRATAEKYLLKKPESSGLVLPPLQMPV